MTPAVRDVLERARKLMVQNDFVKEKQHDEREGVQRARQHCLALDGDPDQ